MELLNSLVSVPYIFHGLIVSIVLLGAVLVFVFGFRSTEEPSFNKGKTDSKSVAKKKKAKDKVRILCLIYSNYFSNKLLYLYVGTVFLYVACTIFTFVVLFGMKI